MMERSFSAASVYRYGFNGQETDDEVAGKGNSNTAEFWQYDTRLGRRWNMDPEPISGISDYACFTNSPIWLNDILGNSVDVGKKKEIKKETKILEENSMNADAGDVDENLRVKKTTKFYTDEAGNELDDKQVKEIQQANQKIAIENAEAKIHNNEIDKKIELFKGMGFDATYNPETGLLDKARKTGGDLEPYQQTLFDAVNSGETYTLKTGGKNAFAFGSKNSGTISKDVLFSPNKPVLQKLIAADAAEFLGVMDTQEASFKYLLNKNYPKNNDPTIKIDENKIHFNYVQKLKTKTLQNPATFNLTK